MDVPIYKVDDCIEHAQSQAEKFAPKECPQKYLVSKKMWEFFYDQTAKKITRERARASADRVSVFEDVPRETA